MLRSVSSSPASEQTLQNRSLGLDAELAENVNQLGMLGSQAVYDLDSGDESAIMDNLPGANESGDKTPAWVR